MQLDLQHMIVVQACKQARHNRRCVVEWHPHLWRCEAQLPACPACASAGNRTRITSMATMYSTTRPPMQLHLQMHRGEGTLAHFPHARPHRKQCILLIGHRCSHTCRLVPAFVHCRSVHMCACTTPPTAMQWPHLFDVARPAVSGSTGCIGRESNPGHIDGNDVFYH